MSPGLAHWLAGRLVPAAIDCEAGPPAPVQTRLSARATEAIDRAALATLLMQTYFGLSSFLAREIATRALPTPTLPDTAWFARLEAAWEALPGAAAREAYSPIAILPQAGLGGIGGYPFPLASIPAEAQRPAESLNAALDSGVGVALEARRREEAFAALRARIGREVKRFERQRQSTERTLQEVARADTYRESGELLLANLHQVTPGATETRVPDYYAPELAERAIALDPKLSAQENAEAYFRLARKARDSQETALERGMQAEQALHALHRAQQEIERVREARTESDAALRQIEASLRKEGLLSETPSAESRSADASGPDFQGHKIRRVLTPEGYEIYYGETATANDYLTTRLASPNDLWLHVRAAPSAHVVIRTHGKPEAVPSSVLQRAALLCAQHSGQKHSSLVPVDYTLKKYVRKPRGAPAGTVQIQQEKTLHVSP